VRNVDPRRLHAGVEERERVARTVISRLTCLILIGCRVRHRDRFQPIPGQPDRADFIFHLEIDRAHRRGIARAPQGQIAPFILLDWPDRTVLVEPIRVRLVGEGNPGWQDAPLAILMDPGDHEAEAVGDRRVRLPCEIGDFAVAPRARLDDPAHRSPPTAAVGIKPAESSQDRDHRKYLLSNGDKCNLGTNA